MAKKRVDTYWDNRAVSQEQKVHDSLPVVEKKVFDAYAKAQDYLTKQASNIYQRYITKTGSSKEDVAKILNTSISTEELFELKRLANTIEDPGIKKQVQNYLDGLSVKYRITMLDDLKAKSFIVSKQIASVQQIQQTDYYIDVIQEAYDQASAEAIIGQTERWIQPNENQPQPYKYNPKENTIEIVDWQTGTIEKEIKLNRDPPFKFKELSTKEAKNILSSEWVGRNYSESIYQDTDLLADKLQTLFAAESMSGMTEREMAREIENEFNVSSYVAKRLIRTEANYMANQAKLKGWKEHGVKEYVIVAVLDFRTSKICQEQDGKIYKVLDAVVSLNFPPFHPWCRTVVRAYFGKRTLKGTRIANDPINGTTFTINMSDSYKDWEEKLIEAHGKNKVELDKKELRNFNRDQNQYDMYKELIGDNMPDSVEDMQRLKYNGSRDWKLLKLDYRRRKSLLDQPELKLPNSDAASIDDNKFTGYLFNADNPRGFSKGKLFESRLGYNANNYGNLKQAILDNVINYPSTFKGDNQYGSRYEVNMILYDQNRRPTNVKTAWLVSDQSTHMTTTLIEEAK